VCQSGVWVLSPEGVSGTTLRTLWNPIGQLSKISSRPGNCANSGGQNCAMEILEVEEVGGKGRKERTAYIERVYEPVELLNADVFHCASPLDAIEDHLLCLGRIVPAGFQEAPVRRAERARAGACVKTKEAAMK